MLWCIYHHCFQIFREFKYNFQNQNRDFPWKCCIVWTVVYTIQSRIRKNISNQLDIFVLFCSQKPEMVWNLFKCILNMITFWYNSAGSYDQSHPWALKAFLFNTKSAVFDTYLKWKERNSYGFITKNSWNFRDKFNFTMPIQQKPDYVVYSNADQIKMT